MAQILLLPTHTPVSGERPASMPKEFEHVRMTVSSSLQRYHFILLVKSARFRIGYATN